jgi:4a-hydroxytetrahydrobiopterin dehydratase
MKLAAEEIKRRLASAPGWTLDGDAVMRQYVFASFPDAVAFATRLAFDAEAADHHPDLTISYKRVTVRWSTHDESGVSEKDFEGVRQSDAAASRFPQSAS